VPGDVSAPEDVSASEDVSARFASLCGADDPVPDVELTAIVEDDALEADEPRLVLPSLAELGVVPAMSVEEVVAAGDAVQAAPTAPVEMDVHPTVPEFVTSDVARDRFGSRGRVAALAAGVALLISVGVLTDQIWGPSGTGDSLPVADSQQAGLAEPATLAAVPVPRVEALEEVVAVPVAQPTQEVAAVEEAVAVPVVEAIEQAGALEEVLVAPVVQAIEEAAAVEDVVAAPLLRVLEAAGVARAAVTEAPRVEALVGLEVPEELVASPSAELPTVDQLTAEAVAALPGVVDPESDLAAGDTGSELASREQRLAAWYGGAGWPAMSWASLDLAGGQEGSAWSAENGLTEQAPALGDERASTAESPAERAPRGRPGRAIAGMKPPRELAAPDLGDELLPVTIRAGRGSRIEIDGIDRGKAPLFGLLLPAGSHRIVELSERGMPVEVLFEVSDENLRLDFTRDIGRSTKPLSDTGLGAEPQRADEADETRAQAIDSPPVIESPPADAA